MFKVIKIFKKIVSYKTQLRKLYHFMIILKTYSSYIPPAQRKQYDSYITDGIKILDDFFEIMNITNEN